MTRSISFSRPMMGSILPARTASVRLMPSWSMVGVLLARLVSWAGRGSARLGQHPDDLVADLVQVHAQRLQDARGDALALAHESQQQVLRADVVVAQAARLVDGQLDDPLGAGRQADLAHDRSVAAADDELDRGADLGQLDVHVLEHARSDTLALAHEAQQQVLRADVVVVEPLRLVLGKRQDLACAISELVEPIHRVEHPFYPRWRQPAPAPMLTPSDRRSSRRRDRATPGRERPAGEGGSVDDRCRRVPGQPAAPSPDCDGLDLGVERLVGGGLVDRQLGDLVGDRPPPACLRASATSATSSSTSSSASASAWASCHDLVGRPTASASASTSASVAISSAMSASASASAAVSSSRAAAYSSAVMPGAAASSASSASVSASASVGDVVRDARPRPAPRRSASAATSSATASSACSSATSSVGDLVVERGLGAGLGRGHGPRHRRRPLPRPAPRRRPRRRRHR